MAALPQAGQGLSCTRARPEAGLMVPAAGARARQALGAGGGRPSPPLKAGPGSWRRKARHTHPWACRLQGEGCSSLSLSTLSCDMGVTDTTLGNEPQSIL